MLVGVTMTGCAAGSEEPATTDMTASESTLIAQTSSCTPPEAARLTMEFSPHIHPNAPSTPVTVLMRDGGSPNLETPHPQGVTIRASGLIVNGSDSVRAHAWTTLNAAQTRSVAGAPYFNLTLHMPLDRGERASPTASRSGTESRHATTARPAN